MNIVFISNYLNHHQLPFCNEMIKATNGNFVFIATSKMKEERVKLGYKDLTESCDFAFCTEDSEENKQKAIELCNSCDVLIHGSAPDEFFKTRINQKKLTFKYGERFFKTPFTFSNIFKRTLSMLRHIIPYQNKNHYLLCASAYMPNDCRLFGCFKNRMYRWGYFPEVKEYNLDELMAKKQKSKLLWVGRMIDWKHPEYAVRLAKQLKERNFEFELNMIGCGDMETDIADMIKREKLTDCVNMLGSMPPENVREHMEQAEIFLFTSDRKEGWGAVLNESMNSGCAVIASNVIGAVPFLLKDGENGLVYNDGDFNAFCQKAASLLENHQKAEELGRKAYNTLATDWNAEAATKRLMELIDSKLNCGQEPSYSSGPCSKAEYI